MMGGGTGTGGKPTAPVSMRAEYTRAQIMRVAAERDEARAEIARLTAAKEA